MNRPCQPHPLFDSFVPAASSWSLITAVWVGVFGWGYARVEVASGGGVLTLASVIDSRTGDAMTIAMKR